MKSANPSLILLLALLATTSLKSQDFCFADSLHLGESVKCHPSSRYLELAFDLRNVEFEGQLIFEAHVDSLFIANVWMEPEGKMLIHSSHVGKSFSLCQAWQEDCCRTFDVPLCTETVCPLFETMNVRLVEVDTEAGVAHYQYILLHESPLETTVTEFAILNEDGVFLDIASIAEEDSVVDLYTTIDTVDRTYVLCDLFNSEQCMIDLVLPKYDPTVRVKDLAELGARAYPNPVADQFTLDLGEQVSPDGGRVTYRIFNSAGQVLDAGVVERQVQQFSTDTYPAGMYYLSLTDGGAMIGQHRFAKLR